MEQIRSTESIAAVRTVIWAANAAGPQEEVNEKGIEHCMAVIDEFVAETERLRLYKNSSFSDQ